MRQFCDAFNREDLSTLDELWTSPFVYVMNSETKKYAKYRDFANFEKLRASGWAQTRFDDTQVLIQDTTSAVVNVKLVRLKIDNTELASGNFTVVLTKQSDQWKIRLGINHSNLPVGR